MEVRGSSPLAPTKVLKTTNLHIVIPFLEETMTVTTEIRDSILEKFKLFQGGTGGLDSWLAPGTPDGVFEALANIENQPLSKARLNQLLTLAHEAPISNALFHYYWLSTPDKHPYRVRKVPCFDSRWIGLNHVESLDHLYWGLYRFYVDALLYFGNIRIAFQRLRRLTNQELTAFFQQDHIDIESMSQRGDPIGLKEIAKDNRYLISEMACKSFEAVDVNDGELAAALIDLYDKHRNSGGGPVTVKQLLTGAYAKGELKDRQLQFDLSTDEFSEEIIQHESDLLSKIKRVSRAFASARDVALKNTRSYLSMVGDLDVYIATSMRERNDFRAMADFCESVFGNKSLHEFKLRYFDPTLSAASHHEDKGLIECLMVKCAKVLVLHAGSRDSYGKDAEAAMALSLGKPVIIHADQEYRSRFFRDIHPLSRLINFDTGVAIGAMVATCPAQVVKILRRIFSNDLEYELSQSRPGYLVLKEGVTGSIVRLQTSDELLRETFWNHYHNHIR